MISYYPQSVAKRDPHLTLKWKSRTSKLSVWDPNPELNPCLRHSRWLIKQIRKFFQGMFRGKFWNSSYLPHDIKTCEKTVVWVIKISECHRSRKTVFIHPKYCDLKMSVNLTLHSWSLYLKPASLFFSLFPTSLVRFSQIKNNLDLKSLWMKLLPTLAFELLTLFMIGK